MHQLIEEQVRDPDAAANDIDISRFESAVGDQVIAKRQHRLPVLARVGVGDHRDLVGRYRSARLGQQRRMSRSTRRSAPAAASAPLPVRPAPPPMRCRRLTR